MSSTAEAAAGGTGDPLLFAGGDDSACSTPFVSAPSSPSRDRDLYHHGAACFYSAPASPTRNGGAGKDFSGVLDFDFDFSSRFPSPSAAAMSSADELFCNGQIRPVRLSAALLQPQQPAASPGSTAGAATAEEDGVDLDAAADERGRFRGRSVRRKARSLSPFRTHWRRSPAASATGASPPPPPETESADEPAVTPAASRSSSSSSTASSASTISSSSSSRGGSRRWARGFLKDLLHRSKSDGGKSHVPTAAPVPATSPSPTAAPKRSPSPSPSPATRSSGAARGGRRRSAHERLYEARRAEAEEMRRRTNLPYRQGGFLLFGCIGLGHRSYGAVHGLARGLNAAAAVSSRS
ncbi:hypothetical protein HU200_052411 [Digitaria exilis]|uniref:Uncharacterized protein n=1 Tax=Digitaria exilis TaxID=1010633 RepID=A0A835AR50_9POAL|nr:hypothetical protein HU200_052411 [Digitaria exilis]